MATKISAISGFPEYLPAQQRAFDAIVARIRSAYESFGYTALETAVVERTDTLLAKGIDAKEVYGLRRLAAGEGEDGAKELALRFDLTVPTARYVAQNYGQLVFPFRRHQIQPVWRGERPQAGRYRQFHQCDIDYIADGAGALPLAADAEILACAVQALRSLGLKFVMQINNRKLLLGLLNQYGFIGDNAKAATKVIDDFLKSKPEDIFIRLMEIKSDDYTKEFFDILTGNVPQKNLNDFNQILKNQDAIDGRYELDQVLTKVKELLGPELTQEHIAYRLDIVRGLDYYTGTVVETFLCDDKGKLITELGSICSGGRYENLAENLSERALPGVGISIGISRIATWLMTQSPWADMPATCADVYVAYGLGDVAAQLRAVGLKVEEGLDDKPLGKQLMNAEKRGLRMAVVGVEGEMMTLRTFATRADAQCDAAAVARMVRGA